MICLRLLTRPGCHLCDEMKKLLNQLSSEIDVSVEEVDITGNKTLERQFGSEIPVLMHKHEVVAKVRTSKALLLEQLRTTTA
ncbi:MAG TPA: glutaredoxin family protein [Acidobacteria bacterium]|nr:glutaredoxin family protein [Acidobacteriota bacterium]